jgi:hypothetical protein
MGDAAAVERELDALLSVNDRAIQSLASSTGPVPSPRNGIL